jgi:phosphoglycerate dehydrogenase-like enzyme
MPRRSAGGGAYSIAMKKLTVLYLPPTLIPGNSWGRDVIEVIKPPHELRLYDRNLPVGPQIEWADVGIDFGGIMGTREMADFAGGIKLWQVLGNGIDQFDLEYWRSKNVPVANCPGNLTGVPLAECALMLMLMLSRHWHGIQRSVQSSVINLPLGDELAGKVLLIIGFGSAGRELACRAAVFGMRIQAIDVREINADEKRQFGIEFATGPDQLDHVLATADYVSLHLHLTEKTKHIFDERRIRLMKSSAFLINVARGGLVDCDALARCLQEGQPAGAGLDVTEPEPITTDHPLLHLPNVVVTNHIAGNTYGTWRRRADFTGENVRRISMGLEPLALINQRSDVMAPPAPAVAEPSAG